jgi:hypothetical protein
MRKAMEVPEIKLLPVPYIATVLSVAGSAADDPPEFRHVHWEMSLANIKSSETATLDERRTKNYFADLQARETSPRLNITHRTLFQVS